MSQRLVVLVVGLDEEGLYRVSGLYDTVQQLKDLFEKGELFS